MRRLAQGLLLAVVVLGGGEAMAQRQLPDLAWTFTNASPAWAAGQGPLILLSDTASDYVKRGSMDPLLRLAETDGFRTARQAGGLLEALAARPAILVIANPIAADYESQPAMTPPSAFTEGEIAAVRAYVEGGGALLLLADHAPFGGGSSALAGAFGLEFLNGNTVREADRAAGRVKANIDYRAGEGLNGDHPIVDGSTGRPPIRHYFAFGGQSFIPSAEAMPLLTVPAGWTAVFTYRLRAELASAPAIDASGMAQGVTLEPGAGRAAVFAEAGGFTAQIIDGRERFGFNSPEGADNPDFVLATLRWLARYTPAR